MASLDEYKMYRKLVEKCHCESCNNVLEFDDRQQEEGITNDTNQRPMHCHEVELAAQLARKFTHGLSASSLTNCEYFFSSTPRMSAPTFSLLTPMDVQWCTWQYMGYFCQAIPADYRYPDGWLRTHWNQYIENELVEVLHENHPMLDGDSGHLVVDAETKVFLVALTTHLSRHHNTIHFRTRYDVLELGTAFKLYGERRQEAVPEDISFRS